MKQTGLKLLWKEIIPGIVRGKEEGGEGGKEKQKRD